MVGRQREARGRAEIQARVEEAVGRTSGWLARSRLTRTPWAVFQTFQRAQGGLLSGSMAYYTFLSLLPLVMVAGFVLGTASQGSDRVSDALVRAVEQLLPGVEGRDLLDQLIQARVAFGIVGLVTVLYASIGFVGSVTVSLNRLWGVPPKRGPLGQRLLNLGVVILLGVVLLGSVAATAWVGGLAVAAFGEEAGLVASLLDFLAAPVAVFMALLLLYRLLPAIDLTWRSQVPGAVVGTIGIEVLKRGFAVWAARSDRISALPRSVVSVVLLLVWFGFFSQLILYGAAYNVVRSRRRTGPASRRPQRSGDVDEQR